MTTTTDTVCGAEPIKQCLNVVMPRQPTNPFVGDRGQSVMHASQSTGNAPDRVGIAAEIHSLQDAIFEARSRQ